MGTTQRAQRILALLTATLLPLAVADVLAAQNPEKKPPRSWPMFGGSPGRNMVNLVERRLVAAWCVQDGKLKNVKWSAELLGHTFGSPIVANGRVFIGTNKSRAREKGWAASLTAYRENDGKLLWQNTHDHPDKLVSGWSYMGLPSAPAVDGAFLYYLTPACDVICADCETGKIAWRYDLVKELKVYSSPGSFHTTPPLASPLVGGELVFVVTGNGTDWEGKLIAPQAPSFVALHKKTGKLAWQSNLPGDNVIEGQWSSPAFAIVNNVPQVIFAGGDCVIYGLEPQTGKLLWKCDCLPTRKKRDDADVNLYIVGTPVVVGERLYVGMGVMPDRARMPRSSYFLCLDITKKGDVSLKSYDAKAAANKNSALVWAFGGPIDPEPKGKGERRVYFGNTNATAAVLDGLVYITERAGYLHCLDAATGRREWQHDVRDTICGSAYWVDGRVFVAGEGGEMTIFAHGTLPQILAKIDMDDIMSATPVAANGVLYVATRSKLYAIGAP